MVVAKIDDGTSYVPIGATFDDKFRTFAKMIFIQNPTASDSYLLGRAIPYSSTIIKVTGETDVGTVDFNIEKRATVYAAGTDVDSTEFVAATPEMSQDSGFESPGIAAGDYLRYVASAVASSPTEVTVTVTFTVD